ncbi:MAG: 16S rRNA (cytosine(1402)-N(4))-methyltransferase RsmH [Anaplasmataceae bacterium]|nr:16S rRNA (cytosine(1402)-N(4))-methyltransferase RsmH [Anaplasmataceae bacterium]
MNLQHKPVMIKEVFDLLSPIDNGTYVDATFGAGGYSKYLLDNKPSIQILAIDRDPLAIKMYDKMDECYRNKIKLHIGNFADIDQIIATHNFAKIDGIIFDIGVSSMQLDDHDRGFSFDSNSKLDMRMDTTQSTDASTFISSLTEEEMANIIYDYSDERYSRRIAKAIVEARKNQNISTTNDLASIVRRAIPYKGGKIDNATRTFQAIRIWVNKELESLSESLLKTLQLLSTDSKIITVSFHSTEDAIIKDIFKQAKETKKFKLLNKKVIKPSIDEIKENHRSRSAKVRGIVKL